jgi:hypothetical protein
MPERPRRPDLDERFSLYPMEAEEVMETLLQQAPGTTSRQTDDGDDLPEVEEP